MSANRPDRALALETVLDDFALSFDHAPDHAQLRAWLDRHPAYRDQAEYRAAVIDYAARWSMSELLAPDLTALPADRARVARAKEIVSRVVADLAPVRPITSLLAEVQSVNLSAQEAAARAGLSVPLFAQLDRRLIHFDLMPEQLFARIASAIGRSLEEVRVYLSGPSVLPHGAQFRADHVPVATGATLDFFAAVRADPVLSEDEKQEWLALVPPDRGSA